MGDVSISSRQFGDIPIIETYDIHQDQFGPHQADALGVEHWRESEFLLQIDFVSVDLGQMHGDDHISLPNQFIPVAVQFRGDVPASMRIEPDMDKIISSTLPLTRYGQDARQADLPVRQARMHRVVLFRLSSPVYNDPDQAGPDATLLSGSDNAFEAISVR